jgi:hypothetical protein
MAIEDIVHITIKRGTQTVSKASFATIAIAGYHTHWGASEYVRSYSPSSALATLVAEGFATTDPVYLAAQEICSQNPRPSSFKILKLSTTWSQKIRLTPVAANTTVYSGTVAGLAWTFTSDSSATLTEVCTGIAAAIDALAGVSATGVSNTYVDITVDAAAKLVNVAKGTSAGAYEFEDITPATNLAAELGALRLLDSKWYGLVLDNQSSVRITAAAAYVETIQALMICNTADSLCLDPASTTDIMYTNKALSHARSALIYSGKYDSFAGAAWLGAVLPYGPGGATYAFKVLKGVAVDNLSETQQNAIAAKRGNFYVDVADQDGTRWGITASGEYIDTTVDIDFLQSRWSERLFALLSSSPKLPYTDASGVKIKSELAAVNGIAVRQGVLTADPAPTVSCQKVADIAPSDRAARLFPGVEVTGRLAGAIHEIDVSATLDV